MRPTPSFEELITQLAPTLAQLETERQKIEKKVLKRIFGSFLIIGVMVYLYIYIIIRLDWLLSVSILGLLTYALATPIPSHTKRLNAKYKKTIISRMVEIMVENGKYTRWPGIPRETFNESGLFEKPGRYSSEDLITGKVGKTKFRSSEVHAGKSGTDGWLTIFQGFMFIADFHKHFAGHTTVSRNFLFKEHGRVRLENPEFEKRFDVFSDDQIEARYLLTPSMMERIVELDKQFDNGIVLSFCRSNIMIFISDYSTNHFEISLWSKIDNKETLFREYSIISALIAIVDDLNLNTRIWTKE